MHGGKTDVSGLESPAEAQNIPQWEQLGKAKESWFESER